MAKTSIKAGLQTSRKTSSDKRVGRPRRAGQKGSASRAAAANLLLSQNKEIAADLDSPLKELPGRFQGFKAPLIDVTHNADIS